MPDIWFYKAAWILTIVGIAVLAMALFRDRPRGRRRCPKCWYDLSASGDDNLRCSECGYLARQQKKLRKTRRHWRWAVFGVIVLLGAVASSATPKIKRDGAWHLAPNTALILMAPDANDALAATPMKDEALRRLLHDRLHLKHDPHFAHTVLWDWQWSLLFRRAASYLEASSPAPNDASCQLFDFVLLYGLGNGLVHEVGCDENVGALRRPPNASQLYMFGSRKKNGPGIQFFADQQIGVQLHGRGPFANAVNAQLLTVTIDENTQSIPFKKTGPPYTSWCATGAPRWYAVVQPVQPLDEGMHTLHFRIRETVPAGQFTNEHDGKDLFLAEYTIAQTIHIEGSYHDFIRPDFDPRLDDRVRRNVSLEVDFLRRSICVRLNPYWLNLQSWIGRIWRLDLIRNDEIVACASRTLEAVGCVQFAALPVFPDVFAGTVEGDWKLRFQMDPESMIVWNMASDYWAGLIEVPIDWEAERAKLRASVYK